MAKVRGFDAWGRPIEVDEPEDLRQEFEGKTEFGERIVEGLPYAEYSDAQYEATYDETFPTMAALRPARGTEEAPTIQQTKALSEIAKQRGKPILGDEVRERMRTGDFETLDLGGSSEKLAKQVATGVYEVPTDESLDLAVANAFPKFQRRIRGNPTFGALQWEQPGAAGGGAQQTADPADVPSLATWEMPSAAPTEDEYGWGIAHAFSRGLIRAGQLVDLATGDVEEYAEGAEELKKYGISEEDEKRLQELRETNGFWKGLGYYITNPSLALQVVAESGPLSIPTLVGAAAGALVAGPAGAIGAGAAGSGITEYLATIGDALGEEGIDQTDPEALKAAFADKRFMAAAREDAIERGIGVALFDALSIGLAGRIYKPVKALTGTATKTGAVLGGTSEILAQGFAGAGGEGAAQILDVGRIEEPTALSGEFVGELVPGLGEMAISKIGKTPAERDVPDTTGGTTPLPPTGPGGVPITEEEAAAIDAEAEPRKREPKPPPSEAKTATTPPTETKETAPTPQEEEVPIEELLASAAKKEEAAYKKELEAKDKEEAAFEQEAAEEEEFVSPLVNTKTLGPKIGSTITSAEVQKPVRDAWRNLMQTLAKRYPETTATVPKSRFSGTGIAKFLKTLQDEVDLTTDIPEINELITQISEQEQTADIINVLDRLSSKIRGETPSLADAPIGSVSAAVQAAYNDFVEYYETHQRVSKAKKTKGQVTLKGSSIAMANKLGEMAAATRELLTAAYEAGVLEEAGIGAEYGKTIQIALEAADAAQAPFEKRTKGGGKTKGIAFARDTLFKNAQNLKDIAEKVTPLLAEVEARVAKARGKAETTEVSDVDRVVADIQAEDAAEAAAALQETEPGPAQGQDALDAMVGTRNRRRIRSEQAEVGAKAATERIQKQSKEAADVVEKVGEKPEKGKGKGKVEPTSAATEAPAKPKTETKGERVRKQAGRGPTVKQLRVRAKELNIAGRSKLTRHGLIRAIEKAEKQPEVQNKEEVERQKTLVPKRYHGEKYFFHVVRDDGDVASIVNEGLRPGTNVSRIGGQALEVEGGTVLVFEGKTDQKDYQDDGLARGGEKPIAIIKDTALDEREAAAPDNANEQMGEVFNEINEIAENYGASEQDVRDLAYGYAPDLQRTKSDKLRSRKEGKALGLTDKAIDRVRQLGEQIDKLIGVTEEQAPVTEANVLDRYRTYGVPVYSTKGTKVKPDVKGAKPEEVFDKKQNITGREAGELQESVDAKNLDEAFEIAGVTKESATRIRGAMGSLDEAGKRALTDAAYEFARKKDPIRFATQLQEILEKTPSPELMDAYTEFYMEINERKTDRLARQQEETRAREEDATSFLSDDERAIAELTGAIEPEIDPDETTVDEYGVPLSARLRKIFEPHGSLTPAEKARFRVDSRILTRVVGRITKRLLASTKSPLVENPDKISMQELVGLLLEGMPKNHRFAHLLKLLKRTNVDMEILLHDNAFGIDESGRTAGIHRPGRDADGKFDPDKSRIELVFDMENRGEANFVKTALHEMIHAVTVARYMVDKRFARHIDQLFLQSVEKFRQDYPDFPDIQQLIEDPRQTPEKVTAMVKEYLSREEGLGAKYYGLANPLEFMAEAFTNPYFQEFLGGIQLEASPELLPNIMRTFRATARLTGLTSILEGFLNAVKKAIGISRRNTVLEEVIVSTTANFDTNISLPFARGKFRSKRPQKSEDVGATDKALVNETADLARQRNKQVKQTYEALKEGVQGLPRAINLGYMNRDVIERNYRDLFARASRAAGYAVSPLTRYIKAKQAASQLAEEFSLKAADALKALQKFDTKTRSQVFALMRDTTMAQVWPHVSLQDKMNDHLWTKPNKKTGKQKLKKEYGEKAKEARKKWVALNKQNPAAAKLLIKMAKLTQEIQNRKRIEALQATGQTYKVPEAVMKKLIGLETKEDIQKMFPGMYDKQGDLVPANTEKVRPADTIIEDGDTKSVREAKREKLAEWQNLRNIAQTAEEIIKGSTIQGPYFPLRRYGKYVVSSTDDWNSVKGNKPYVSFHNTKAEARRVAAAIEKEYGIPTFRSKKIEDMSVPSSVETVTAELARRVGTNRDGITDEMSRRLKTAMIEIMADNTAYASQLKRMNVDGVAADDMGRAFEEYVFVTKYTLGDLATSHEVHQALKDLKKLQKSEDLTDADLDLIGDVVNEIANQNKEDAKDREMSTFQKGVGLIGFFNFLGAPSYWVLNATQTLTVTLPYIGSKWGVKGTAAYMEAAKTVLAAAKNAKSYEQFKLNLPESAQLVVAELEKQGIIQSTIAHQFGDIMNPSTLTKIQDWAGPLGKATSTALKLMETIPEGVEKYNRISTALAVYNLSGGSIVQTADAVQATQFNYDSANRARLMKAAPKWAGGGLRAIITPAMMFKSYGIGLTRLLYGGMLKAVMTKRPHETVEQAAARRQEGRRIAGGLIVSHTFFGGVAGGIMMAPVQGLVSVFNEVFREAGDEFDPDEAVELYLQDVANDTIAALVSRGVPASLGIDMSKSINLGNLLWMGNDRINLGDAGGVETALTTALGPVAQYGITTVREGARIWKEDPRANWYDFLAAAMPVKAVKGAIRGAKYEFTGIGTDTLTFVDRDDVTGWMRMAMGFRPTNVAMTTDYEYNLMDREARQSRRKSALVDRALRADTAAEKAVAWREIDKFNRSIDARRDRITKGDVVRLRSRRRSRQREYDRERR